MMKIEQYLDALEKYCENNSAKKMNREAVLWHLLTDNIEDVRYVIEEADIYGIVKSFRQIDVTDNSHINSALWWLLNHSKGMDILEATREKYKKFTDKKD